MRLYVPGRSGRWARAGGRWARLLSTRGGLRLGSASSTVTTACPAPGDPVAGGTAKFQRLAARFPNHPTDFTLLYLGSTWLPRDLGPLLRLAATARHSDRAQSGRRRLSGVGRERDRRLNRPLRRVARRGRPRPLPERVLQAGGRRVSRASRKAAWEVLYNAVDVDWFTPGPGAARTTGRCCCSAATSTRRTGSSSALQTLAVLLPAHPDAQLLVTGRLASRSEPLVERSA